MRYIGQPNNSRTARARELRARLALLDRMEAMTAPAYAGSIRRYIEAAAESVEVGGAAPETTQHYAEIITTTEAGVRLAAEAFYGRAAGAKSARLERRFIRDLVARLMISWLNSRAVRARIVGIADETRAWVFRQIARASEEGVGPLEAARAIRKVAPQIAVVRAETIARTEMHGAATYASQEGAASLELELVKEWASADDPRTRPAHREADGQVVAFDAQFIVGGEYLIRPGDPNGSAANVINCRCAALEMVKD